MTEGHHAKEVIMLIRDLFLARPPPHLTLRTSHASDESAASDAHHHILISVGNRGNPVLRDSACNSLRSVRGLIQVG